MQIGKYYRLLFFEFDSVYLKCLNVYNFDFTRDNFSSVSKCFTFLFLFIPTGRHYERKVRPSSITKAFAIRFPAVSGPHLNAGVLRPTGLCSFVWTVREVHEETWDQGDRSLRLGEALHGQLSHDHRYYLACCHLETTSRWVKKNVYYIFEIYLELM